MTVQLVIVEDDARYRDSVATLFHHSPGYEVAAEFATASAAIAAARTRPAWDIALMDIDVGEDITGIDATSEIKQLLPDLKVVMLTVFEDPSAILQAICAGADGYMLKSSTAKQLREQVGAVLEDASPLTPAVARTVLDLVRKSGAGGVPGSKRPQRLDLTEREQDVLRCLVKGNSYQKVADALGVRIDTVRTHIRNLYRKLQVNTAAEAVSRALQEGLV